ncbi:MAG: chloride channel protein [Pseudomonadota bacterium]
MSEGEYPRPWAGLRQQIGARRLRVLGWKLSRLKLHQILTLWPLSIIVGVAVGYAVTGFRVGISELQTLFYGADDEIIHSVVAALPWYLVLPIPILGGLAVGLILNALTPDGKARGIADVIEAAALHGGRVHRRAGIASALAALVTLSTGGSTGREGPAVHIGAVFAAWVSEKLRASAITGRDILGCAAAAAVSASFNAPLAGALFALEVVLRHYALHAFGPIVISSVAAAIVSRLYFGDITEYELPSHTLSFYWEIPGFVILGILSGLAAVAMTKSLLFAEAQATRLQRRTGIPNWLRPAVAGAVLGVIALQFPHIIGVGYETTTLALTTQLTFTTALIFAVVKVAAVAVTYAGHMGGGVFSPALMVGALLGTAFGAVAIDVFPSVVGSQGLYALAGLGAVASAVLGAPISSTLIVFELTGDYQAGIAVMITVSLASVISDRCGVRSFFLCQLEKQGVNCTLGPQGYLKSTLKVSGLMRLRGQENGASDTACWDLFSQGAYLRPNDTLEQALPMLDQLKGTFLPVVEEPLPGEKNEPELIGALFIGDALRAYNRALEEELREEHA